MGDTGGQRSQATVPPCAASSAVPYDSHSNICLYGNRHAARRQHIRGKRMQLAQNLRSQGTAHCNMSEEAPRMYRAPSPLPHATIEAHQRLSDRWEDVSEIRVKRCEQFEPGKPGHVKPHLPLTVSSRQGPNRRSKGSTGSTVVFQLYGPQPLKQTQRVGKNSDIWEIHFQTQGFDPRFFVLSGLPDVISSFGCQSRWHSGRAGWLAQINHEPLGELAGASPCNLRPQAAKRP